MALPSQLLTRIDLMETQDFDIRCMYLGQWIRKVANACAALNTGWNNATALTGSIKVMNLKEIADFKR